MEILNGVVAVALFLLVYPSARRSFASFIRRANLQVVVFTLELRATLSQECLNALNLKTKNLSIPLSRALRVDWMPGTTYSGAGWSCCPTEWYYDVVNGLWNAKEIQFLFDSDTPIESKGELEELLIGHLGRDWHFRDNAQGRDLSSKLGLDPEKFLFDLSRSLALQHGGKI